MAGVMSLPQTSAHRHLKHVQTPFSPLRTPAHSRLHVSCHARKSDKQDDKEHKSASPLVATSLAAALASAMVLGGAVFPEDALAARSGGRVGGSAFRSSAPRSAPAPRAAPGRTQNNYYNYSSPPLVGGYGGMGYGMGGGFGGINVFPSFGVPVFGLGSGFFNFVLIALVFSTVTGVVRSLLGGRRRDDSNDFD